MRLAAGLTQEKVARKLGVTQAYLSMMEKGRRPVPDALVPAIVAKLNASPTALPLSKNAVHGTPSPETLMGQLGALGYPGFRYLRTKKRNPAEVLLSALNSRDLASRVLEALPWVVVKFPDMDWDWAVKEAKELNRQNRLGYIVDVARELAKRDQNSESLISLRALRDRLDESRLAAEDTLCHESMGNVERKWLRVHRPAAAKHWNLLTDLKPEHLGYTTA